jgi:hypothetical protein
MKSSLPPDQLEDADEEDEEDEEVETEEAANDSSFKRVKLLVETLLQTTRNALESEPSDFTSSGKAGAKVLSPEEVKSWRSNGSPDLGDSSAGIESPTRVALPDDDDDSDHLSSEDEVESMTRPRESYSSSHRTSPSPSIIITKSS